MKFNSPVYPLCPSFENGTLEIESTKKYISFLEKKGVKHIMTTAGTSQFNLLDVEEVRSFNLSMIDFNGNKIIGMPPLSIYNIKKEIDYYNSKNINDASLLILFPERYYSNEQLISFFKEICEMSNYPILVHGNILRRGNGGNYEYDKKLLSQLSEIDGFIGMKEESSSLEFAKNNLQELDMEIIVAGGSMRRFWSLEPFGATSYLTGVGSFNPTIEENFYSEYMNGDIRKAKEIMTSFETPLFDSFMYIGWHASMRETLHQMGFIKGNREPFVTLSHDEKNLIKKTLKKIL